jgi:hypothetical protein
MTCRRILILFAGVALTACGGSAPSIAPTITSFQATPDTVLAGGTTTLSWTVSGDAPITLELTPDVGDVSGSNDVQVSPDTTTTYTLTATNDVGSDSAPLTVTVQPVVELQGIVIGMNGLPAAGIEVAVDVPGGTPKTTGSDGRFEVATVPVPYDVTLYDAAARHSLTYLGLTVAEPTLLMLGHTAGPQHQTAVSGDVIGTAALPYPQPSDRRTRVAFGSAETRVARPADAASGAFEFPTLPWFGPLRTDGWLHALQWQVDPAAPNAPPTGYDGYARRSLSLQSTTPVHAGQDLTLQPIDEGVLSGATRVPPSYTGLNLRGVSLQFESGARMELGGEPITSEPFSYPTPRVGDGAPTLLALAGAPSGAGGIAVLPGLPDTQSGIELEVPLAATLAEPADGVSGIDAATSFRWSSPAPRVHLVRFQESGGGPIYDVLTDATSASLPDLDALGVEVAPGTQHGWLVYGLEPYADVDATADSDDAFRSAWWPTPFWFPVRAAKLSQTATWSFATAP